VEQNRKHGFLPSKGQADIKGEKWKKSSTSHFVESRKSHVKMEQKSSEKYEISYTKNSISAA